MISQWSVAQSLALKLEVHRVRILAKAICAEEENEYHFIAGLSDIRR